MDARVSVSKDTISKAEKELSTVKRGALLAERLAEVAKSGKLSLARTRFDVASMAGYTEGQRTSGYAWATRMIKIGVLTEEVDGVDKYGKAEYRYYYNPPMAKTQKKVEEPAIVKSEVPKSKLIEYEADEQAEVEQNKTIVSIYHGETTIAIEGIGGDDLIAIIKAITN